MEFLHRFASFAAEIIDRPLPALATTGASLATAEAARTTHAVDCIACYLAPLAALAGYIIPLLIVFWWSRKVFRWIIGVVLSYREMKDRCARCERLSLKCAGCLRNILKSDED